jgi:hypothetical protein
MLPLDAHSSYYHHHKAKSRNWGNKVKLYVNYLLFGIRRNVKMGVTDFNKKKGKLV